MILKSFEGELGSSELEKLSRDFVSGIQSEQDFIYRYEHGFEFDHISRIIAAFLSGRCITTASDLDLKSLNSLDFRREIHFSSDSLWPDFPSSHLCAVLQTSGTTGQPRLVPLRFSQIHAAVKAGSQRLNLSKRDTWLLPLPLNHVGGLSVLFRSLFADSSVVIPKSRSTDAIIEALKDFSDISLLSLVPTQLTRLIQQGAVPLLKNLRLILLGGGPASESLLESCANLEIPVVCSYGMTETFAFMCSTVLGEKQTIGYVGHPLEGVEVKIMADPDSEGEHSESGLLYVRGDQVFEGYLNDESGALDAGRWFNTGDYARVDKNGGLHLLMRREDRIVSGGENIDPRRIESAALSSPWIREACALGVPDDEWGQKLILAVVGDQQTSKEVFLDFLKAKLQAFELPKEIFYLDRFPKTDLGKIKRHELTRELGF